VLKDKEAPPPPTVEEREGGEGRAVNHHPKDLFLGAFHLLV